MATNSLQSLHNHNHNHNHHHRRRSFSKRRHSLDLNPSPPTTLFRTTTNIHSLSSTTTFSISPTTSTSSTATSTSQAISYDLLHQHLSAKNFRQADEETRRLLIALAGDAAVKRGYVFFSEVQFIPEADLRTIDDLWRQHSDDKFGYSVQKKIWEKSNKDFTNFFIKVGWMKKLDTEVEQYNYRSFPNEFTWELTDQTPIGHLPLTNALRGTQLLNSILSHPAFKNVEEGEEDDENGGQEMEKDKNVRDGPAKPFSKRIFKTDYSF